MTSTSEGEEQIKPKRILPLTDIPTHLTFASNGGRLVVAFENGGIAVYDTQVLFSEGSGNVNTLRVFPPSPPGVVRQLSSNPGDLPDLVAVRRDSTNGGNGLVVEVLDTRKLQSIGGWSLSDVPKDIATSSTFPYLPS